MKKVGSLYVLEGTDGAGKGTQTRLIVNRLIREGYDIMECDFPRYGHPAAAKVEQYLNGDFGTTEEVCPYQASKYYAEDRADAGPAMIDHLSKGGIIISNRYVSANQVHQASKIENPKELNKFLTWLDKLEFETNGIPRPDIVFFLNLAYEIGQKNVGKKNQRNYIRNGNADIHELDKDHLRKAHARAVGLVDRFDYWQEIICDDGQGNQYKEPVIHEEIYRRIKKDLETKLAA